VTDGFVVRDRPASNLNGSRRCDHGAVPRAGRTRLAIAEEFQLSFQGLLNGPPDDGLADVDGHSFDGFEVDVESGSLLAVSSPGNNFPPTIGHVAQFGRIFELSLGERHDVFFLELG